MGNRTAIGGNSIEKIESPLVALPFQPQESRQEEAGLEVGQETAAGIKHEAVTHAGEEDQTGGQEDQADLDWSDCQSCVAGQEASCCRLLKRHEAEIARQMWRFSRNRAVCEELVQEVFVQAYLSLKSYRRTSVPFVHWLRRIATRVGYAHWKRQARLRKRGHASLEDHEPEVFSRRLSQTAAVSGGGLSNHEAAETAAEAASAAKLLHGLLVRLPAADRLVLTLMYFEECGTQQIADRTGWNRPMVKMRAMRARRRLKKMIEDEQLLKRLQPFQEQ